MNSTKSMPAILVRHRWLGDLAGRFWFCHPLAVPQRRSSFDPACFGCRARIAFKDLPKPERYRGSAMVESLALRLDLLHEELKLAKVARRKRRNREAAA